ncbi:MAG: hypothetical protein Q8N65_02670 [bacterium]|nr:hypothetical protein [bacterium]
MNVSTFPDEIKILSFPRISLKISAGLILSVGITAIVLMIFSWLWQNGQVVAQTYQLQHLQNRSTNLKKENERLTILDLKENTLFNLEKQIQSLNLEKVEMVSFIQSPGTTVVTR